MGTDWLLWAIGAAAAVGLIVVIFVAGNHDAEQREKFMAQCQQDHKEYECVAMWRAGESHTTVMPMPVIIPTR